MKKIQKNAARFDNLKQDFLDDKKYSGTAEATLNGYRYQMKSYQNLLKAKGITQSMSRKATCLDNAVAENFFGLLKTELFYLEKFDSIDQLEKAIVDYIYYYNNRRIKLKLNGLSPVQYRIQTVGAA
ncbi:MAG: IS3 family transposase [Faecalibacterium prausnitzii]|nr:IS3 family transposase [Faecalibacterium prausnitzii]